MEVILDAKNDKVLLGIEENSVILCQLSELHQYRKLFEMAELTDMEDTRIYSLWRG